MRYSAAELTLAGSEGRRPQPRRLRVATDNPCRRGRCGDFALSNNAYATAQSSIRTSQRAALGELRKAVNAGTDPDAPDFGERANGRRSSPW